MRRSVWCVGRPVEAAVCLIVACVLLSPGRADTLTWEGDVGVNWFEGVAGINTNWHNSAGLQVLPQESDDLIFTKAGTYGGTLTLGGHTVALNSITVGQPNRTADNLPPADDPGNLGGTAASDERILGSNGTIRLGAGGLTIYAPWGTSSLSTGNTRNIRFNTDFELTANTFIRELLPSETYRWMNRKVYLGGEIRGQDFALELSSPNGYDGETKAFQIEKAMPNFVGTLTLNGTHAFTQPGEILGNPSTLLRLSSGGTHQAYLWKKYAGNLTTPNNIEFGANRGVLLFSYGSSFTWTFSGNITGGPALGGSEQVLDLLGSDNAGFDFRGAVQDFTNRVDIRSGVSVTISAANANGEAWPNVKLIRMNSSELSRGTTGLYLRGNFRLTKDITLVDQDPSVSLAVPVRIGQRNNDNGAPFNATFTGKIDVKENDFRILHLYSEAGGSATFTGPIYVAGTYGLAKLGAGSVSVNNRVAQASTGTAPVGPVDVLQGTLLINSPGGVSSFFTTGLAVKDGATLGGLGVIVGDVTLQGTSVATLAPGASIGTLTINGKVDFDSHGRLLVEFGPTTGDRLDVTGTLDLSALDDQLVVQPVGSPEQYAYVIASYGTLIGQFDSLSLPSGYHIEYQYDGLNQIALIAPEPAAVVLLAIGGLAVVGWIRRPKRNG